MYSYAKMTAELKKGPITAHYLKTEAMTSAITNLGKFPKSLIIPYTGCTKKKGPFT